MGLLPRTLIVFENGDFGLVQGSGLTPTSGIYEEVDISDIPEEDFQEIQNNLQDLVIVTRILDKNGIQFEIEE